MAKVIGHNMDSPNEQQRFFVTGGTLPLDAASYIERRADATLFESLKSGEFCYVLNTRQMGKSSLIVRTAKRLRESGNAVAALDLTATGQNVTTEQWYDGLLLMLGSQLKRQGGGLNRCDRALQAFWHEQQALGPMQRFFAAISTVLLPAIDGSLTIFVDEIDAVRSLPFSADEFFGGIRECYNRRVQEPLFHRLTFCLVGVATPADLITDARLSPFNIGRRILLSDFTEPEAAPLAAGIHGGIPTLHRVLYWTNGHPYLTQRLLAVVAEEGADQPTMVDALCERLFLTKAARETDDNLAFVRNRLLRSDADLAALLDLYRKIRNGKSVRDDETNPLCAALRLSGVVAVDDRGFLQVRNRIYDHVFDRAWIEAHLPGAEKRRQRAAYWRGVSRATGIGAAIVVAVGTLAVFAIRQATIAREMEQVANERLSRARMSEGMQYLEQDDPLLAVAPLSDALRIDEADFPDRVQASRMRLDFAKRRAPELIFSIDVHSPILWAERSPDGTRFVAAMENGAAQVWDAETGKPIGNAMKHSTRIRCARFSPDGKRIATTCEDGTGGIWDAETGNPLTESIRYHFRGFARRVDWSHNGQQVAFSGGAGAGIWDGTTGKEVSRIWDTDIGRQGANTPSPMEIRAIDFAPDDKRVVFVADTYLANFSDPTTGKMNGVAGTCFDGSQVTYSPDGRSIVIAGTFANTRRYRGGPGASLIDAQSGRPIALMLHGDRGNDAQYSPDGSMIATAARDGSARLWDGKTGKPLTPPLIHDGSVISVRFRSDGKQIVTASSDGTARVWNTADGTMAAPLLRHAGALRYATFMASPQRVLTVGADGIINLYELAKSESESRLLARYTGKPNEFLYISFVPETNLLNLSRRDGARRVVWLDAINVKTGQHYSLPPFGPTSEKLEYNIFHGDVVFIKDTSGKLGWKFAVWNLFEQRLVLTLPDAVSSISDVFMPGSHLTREVMVSYDNSKHMEGQMFSLETGKAITRRYDTTREYYFYSDKPKLVPMRNGMDLFWYKKSPSGAILIASPDDQWIVLWNARNDAFTTIPCYKREFLSSDNVWFNADEKYAIINGQQTQVWDMATVKPFAWQFTRIAPITCAGFSSDNKLLVTGSEDGVAQVWDFKTGRVKSPRMLHRGTVRRVAFHPDGKILATVASDGRAKLWNARTGEPISPPLAQSGVINEIYFTQDGESLITVSDSEARLWSLFPSRQVANGNQSLKQIRNNLRKL